MPHRLRHPSLSAQPLSRRVFRLMLPLLAVMVLGTLGFMWTEGWDPERALYFTVVTVSTVGYADYEISEAGRRFAVFMILGGFAVMTYFFGQLIQLVVERQLDWERGMRKQAASASDHYIVAGFGRIGRIVCESLHAESIPFVVIDQDRARAEEAARCGYVSIVDDATHDSVLRGAGIERARGLVCLTPSDSMNIVMTLSARGIAPDLPIISRAEDEDGVRKMKLAGATRIISPTYRGAVAVANSITRPHIIDFLDETSESAECVEFCRVAVRPGSPLEGGTIADCGLSRSESLVPVAVKRADGLLEFRPAPGRVLIAGDTVIFAGHPGAVIEFCAEAA
ncbi:MAG: potassium channel family protein [Phycisphaerales bacterium JB041]